MGARLSALHAQLQAAQEQLSADWRNVLVASAVALLAACTTILNHTGGVLPSWDAFHNALQLVLSADAVALRLGAANLQRAGYNVLTEPVALVHDLVLLAVPTESMPNLINGMPAPLFVEWLAKVTLQLDVLRATQGVLAARSACNSCTWLSTCAHASAACWPAL